MILRYVTIPKPVAIKISVHSAGCCNNIHHLPTLRGYEVSVRIPERNKDVP
jgi:hypothetical protein